MEAGPAEPGPWHAWRRPVWLFSSAAPRVGRGEEEALLGRAGAGCPKLVTVLATSVPLWGSDVLSLRSKHGDFLGKGVLSLPFCLFTPTVSCVPCFGPLPSPAGSPLSFPPPPWGPTLVNTLLCLSGSTGR